MQVVVWFAGLRGAIAFALAITLDEARWTYAPTIVTSTLVVILFSNLVVGPLTKPLLVWCARDAQAPASRRRARPRHACARAATGADGSDALRLHAAPAPRVSLGLATGEATGGQLHAPLLPAMSALNLAAATARNLRTSNALKPKSAFHQAWRIIDDHYIKPRIGGKMRITRTDSADGSGLDDRAG